MNKARLTAALLLVALSTSSCSSLPSWMGGRKEDKPKLAGERIAVLPVGAELQPDASLKATAVVMPPANANADWPQHGVVDTAVGGNLALKGALDHVTTATAGNGEAFEHTLIPRPVIADGTAFVMDAVGNISAHDAASIGTIRWKAKGVAEKHEPPVMGGGLAYDQGKLYATSGRGIVVAMDAATGKELWRKSLRVPFNSAPRIAGNRLFAITLDSQIYALDTASGNLLWNQRGIGETAGLLNTVSPAISNDMVIAPYGSGELYALEATSGKEIWNESLLSGQHTQGSALFAGIGGDPVIDGDVVCAVSSGGLLSVMHLTDGQHLWERPIGSINTPWLAGDYFYLLTTDNTVVSVVKYNGHIRWARRLPGFANEKDKRDPITWKGPVLAGGNLALVASNGQLQLISPDDGSLTRTQTIPENVYTSPVVAGGVMYLVGQDATLIAVQ